MRSAHLFGLPHNLILNCMNQTNLSWLSVNGKKLFASLWQPENEPKAVICLVHGFGEHCMRYAPYLAYFIDAGFAVLGYDQIGHGQSEGKRGVISSYNQLLDDVQLCVTKAEDLFPSKPKFLYGHSMGGNISVNYLMKRNSQLAGAILTSPWLALTNNPGFLAKAAVTFIKTFLPNLTMPSGLELKYISTIQDEVEKYKEDELNHGRISLRLVNSIMVNGIWAIVHANKLKIPTLLMHGSDDNITSPIASELFANGNKEYVEFVKWPGCYHELHNDIVREELANKVINWIKGKIK